MFLTGMLQMYWFSYGKIVTDTSRQEGGLQDSDIEILHLLLSHLVTEREQFGIAQEALDTFLKAVRRGETFKQEFCV